MSAPATMANHDIKDLSLADEGRRRTEWAERSMPVLRQRLASTRRRSPYRANAARFRPSTC